MTFNCFLILCHAIIYSRGPSESTHRIGLVCGWNENEHYAKHWPILQNNGAPIRHHPLHGWYEKKVWCMRSEDSPRYLCLLAILHTSSAEAEHKTSAETYEHIEQQQARTMHLPKNYWIRQHIVYENDYLARLLLLPLSLVCLVEN